MRITVSADAVHVGGPVRGVSRLRTNELAEALAHAGLPSIAVADVYSSLFAKLLYNCALNPLGAVLGVHYGALAEQSETRAIMDRVIEETFAVIATMGGTTPWARRDAFRQGFLRPTGAGDVQPSPVHAPGLEQGKPTEVEAMVGYVAAQGRTTRGGDTGLRILGRACPFQGATGASSAKQRGTIVGGD